MSASLETEMKEAIGKHLPQAVGDVLQERLKQADIDAATVERQKEQVATLIAKMAELEAKLRTANEEVGKHIALNKREEEISTRERNAEIASLKVELEASRGNTKFAQEVAMGLVRNTEYRRNVFDNENTSTPIIPEGSGYQAGSACGSANRTVSDTTAAS